MKPFCKIIFIPLLLLIIICCGCFPTYRAVEVDTDTLSIGKFVNVQTKVFALNNDIFLFHDGFSSKNNAIFGRAVVQSFEKQNQEIKNIELPFDSILAMISYEETTSGTRHFGSFLFGLTAPVLTFTGLYCISCPKCCFGSCPTVYSNDGIKYNLEAELFSECISRQLKSSDIDVLKQKPVNGKLFLKITNEALETHYTDKFNLIIAEHPINTQVLPTTRDELTLIKEFIAPKKVITREGENITGLLIKDDERYYRSGVDKIIELKKGPSFDFLDIDLPRHTNNTMKMIIKYRNTLLSTTLLYDIVLGSQGVNGIEWTNKMNSDREYAAQFKFIYNTFSGIKLKLMNSTDYKTLGKMKDAGPLNWKYLVAEIPANYRNEDFLRLEFIPDNFMIDFIAFDTTKIGSENLLLHKINPVKVEYNNEVNAADFVEYVDSVDNNYLKTGPGDSYSLSYNIPAQNSKSQTALIVSEGYYNEWIRGSWIREENDYCFDLYNINETLSVLADSWLENSDLLEEEFFKSKIILREKK